MPLRAAATHRWAEVNALVRRTQSVDSSRHTCRRHPLRGCRDPAADCTKSTAAVACGSCRQPQRDDCAAAPSPLPASCSTTRVGLHSQRMRGSCTPHTGRQGALTACWPGCLLPRWCRCCRPGPPASSCKRKRRTAEQQRRMKHACGRELVLMGSIPLHKRPDTDAEAVEASQQPRDAPAGTHPSLGTRRSTRNWYCVVVGVTTQLPLSVRVSLVES